MGNWQVFAPRNHPLAAPLRNVLARTGTSGFAVCLPENPGLKSIPLLLDAARAAMSMHESPRLLVVQYGWGGGGFARTLHLENPGIATCIVNVPPGCPRAVQWIAAELPAATGFTEVYFRKNGRRLEPRLELAEFAPAKLKPDFCLGPEDVLLVTGGGKGIAAECALALARDCGLKLALIGRSDPKLDKILAANLARVADSGVRSTYIRADVTDADAVRAAVDSIEQSLGPITAVLHGAGANTPRLIATLDEPAFRRTVEPKLSGVENVLAAVDAKSLKVLVAFSSIIARTGLPGEADYAAANEWLSALTKDFQQKHPRCRCLALEWSVWSGRGMGQRLGRIDTLAHQGITAISVDEGVRIFCNLLRQPPKAPSLIVTGRFGEPPTLRMAQPELPLRRFLERKRVFYPGVELVVDAVLSPGTDLYLEDHIVHKERLLPAALGLEAMAQIAMALAGTADMPVFENVEFARPVVVPAKTGLTIRLAALRRENGSIEVCLRSEETDFQADHFRAVCRFTACPQAVEPRFSSAPCNSDLLALDAQRDVYGRILFHQGRFRRLRGYRLLTGKECVAEIAADDAAAWFSPYLPQDFVLGNPAARDAAMHAIQACIPHQRILPTGIERLTICRRDTGARFVRARERSRNGNDFVYDLEVTNAGGDVIERWDGLRLRAVQLISTQESWPPALLKPYLERRIEELAAGSPVKIALERGARGQRPASTDAVIREALGKSARLWRRPDGRPVCLGDGAVSAAHVDDLTLAVASERGGACDMEEAVERTEPVWRDLLGEEKFRLAGQIARDQKERIEVSATRLWAAMECMKKIGRPVKSPLVIESNTADGWALFRSGPVTISTCVAMVRGNRLPLVIAIALCGPAPGRQVREKVPVAAATLRA